MERPEAKKASPKLATEIDSPTGVDDLLLLELQRLTPAERLRRGQERANAVARLQRAVKGPR